MRDQEIHLTPTEYDLLSPLARKSGQVVTHAEMLREVWGRNSEENDHYLRIYIQRLRQKLSDDPLRPEHTLSRAGNARKIRIINQLHEIGGIDWGKRGVAQRAYRSTARQDETGGQ